MESQYYNNEEQYISYEDICPDEPDFQELNIYQISDWLSTRTADNFNIRIFHKYLIDFSIIEDTAEKAVQVEKELTDKFYSTDDEIEEQHMYYIKSYQHVYCDAPDFYESTIDQLRNLLIDRTADNTDISSFYYCTTSFSVVENIAKTVSKFKNEWYAKFFLQDEPK